MQVFASSHSLRADGDVDAGSEGFQGLRLIESRGRRGIMPPCDVGKAWELVVRNDSAGQQSSRASNDGNNITALTVAQTQ